MATNKTISKQKTVYGKVVDINKGTGIICLNDNSEAICPSRYMKKQNGKKAKLNEELEFCIIEKKANRTVVSHSNTFQD